MMNLITIGDLHGSRVWKQIDPGQWDKMIFIGDYVDSAEYDPAEILDNLREIIGLKKAFPDKVVLLWGNHDLAYFYGGHERHYSSGFRQAMLSDLFNIFTANRALFQASYQVENYLWTHAGVVQRWFDTYIKDQVIASDSNLSATLNRLFDDYYEPLFHVSVIRGGFTKTEAFSGHTAAKLLKTRSGDTIKSLGIPKPMEELSQQDLTDQKRQ
jgi:predicted MPP superfamily phosphohydrolase